MECIRGESKLNIKTLNRTLKLSLKRPVRTHHYLNTYIRFNMTDINEITNGLITMDHDYYDRLDGDERVKVLESIILWAKWEMNNQQRWNEQADALFNRELGINQ